MNLVTSTNATKDVAVESNNSRKLSRCVGIASVLLCNSTAFFLDIVLIFFLFLAWTSSNLYNEQFELKIN